MKRRARNENLRERFAGANHIKERTHLPEQVGTRCFIYYDDLTIRGSSAAHPTAHSMRAKSPMTVQLNIKVWLEKRGYVPRGLLAKPVGLPVPLGQIQSGTRCTPRGSLASYRTTQNWAPKLLQPGALHEGHKPAASF